MKTETLSIINKTKAPLPRVPFGNIKNDILGSKYSVSIAIVGPAEIKKLNNEHRQKNAPTDVLSFCLTGSSGELILCPALIKKKAPSFDKSYAEYFLFVVIHGMLHLKGFDHGSTMEEGEDKWWKKYSNR